MNQDTPPPRLACLSNTKEVIQQEQNITQIACTSGSVEFSHFSCTSSLKAEGDWQIAQREMSSDAPIWDGICFHAQQCAEKYLKALLEEHGLDVPQIHDLVVLLDRTQDISSPLSLSRSPLARLSTFGVAPRYPGMDADDRAAAEAVRIAGDVRQEVRLHLLDSEEDKE